MGLCCEMRCGVVCCGVVCFNGVPIVGFLCHQKSGDNCVVFF